MQPSTKHRQIIIIGGIIAGLQSHAAVCGEMSAFRLTGVEGNIAVQRLSDEQLEGNVGETQSRYALTTTEEEFSFLTHSYVYHPNLLNMDLGAGLSYTQNELESPTVNREYDNDLYSLTARLRFLEKKPYPVTLFYDRSNPSVTESHSERFVQEIEKYGVNASLNEPVLPFSMNLDASRQTQEGRGATQIVNNTTDNIQWRAYRTIGKTGYGQLSYFSSHYRSANGISDDNNEPKIFLQDTKSESVSLDTNINFGARQQVAFYNLISYFTQDNLPERQEFRWTPNLTWQHTDDTSSFYRYDYYNSKVENSETLSQTGAVGMRSALTETIAVSGDVHGENIETDGLKNQLRGGSGSITYTKPLSYGRLTLSAGSRYDVYERKTSQEYISVKGEYIRLNGLQKVPLAQQNLLVGQTVRVIHANPDRQHLVLVENKDYEIEIPSNGVGPAYIRWRPTAANLESDEAVLVDYQFKSGGDVVYSNFNQNYNAQLDFLKYYSIYTSYSYTETKIKEGLPTIPLTSTTYIRTGVRVDYPFFQDNLKLGAEAIREDMDDGIAPYVRMSYETYLEARMFSDTQLRLTTRRVIQNTDYTTEDKTYTTQDVDLTRQSARLTMHPFPRSFISLEVSEEVDNGGSIERQIREKAITGQWRLRKLVFTLDGRSIIETQGDYEREHNVFMARLNREF